MRRPTPRLSSTPAPERASSQRGPSQASSGPPSAYESVAAAYGNVYTVPKTVPSRCCGTCCWISVSLATFCQPLPAPVSACPTSATTSTGLTLVSSVPAPMPSSARYSTRVATGAPLPRIRYASSSGEPIMPIPYPVSSRPTSAWLACSRVSPSGMTATFSSAAKSTLRKSAAQTVRTTGLSRTTASPPRRSSPYVSASSAAASPVGAASSRGAAGASCGAGSRP